MIPSLAGGIRLQSDLENIGPEQLQSLFEGWPDPPSASTLHRIPKASYRVALAVDTRSGEVAGFIQAISDGVLTAFIPLLDIRMEFRGQGTGRAMIRRRYSRQSGEARRP